MPGRAGKKKKKRIHKTLLKEKEKKGGRHDASQGGLWVIHRSLGQQRKKKGPLP